MSIPHWAGSMVNNYRRNLNIPDTITDKQIFDILEDCKGMEPSDIDDVLREDLKL